MSFICEHGEFVYPCDICGRQPRYPEHDKRLLAAGEACHVRPFLDWLIEEQGVVFGRFSEGGWNAPIDEHRFAAMTVEQVIAEYFGYDLSKIEEERRAMVEEAQRTANAPE